MEKPVNPLRRTKNPLGKPVEKKGFFIKFSMAKDPFCLFIKTSWIRFRLARLLFLPKNGETFRHKGTFFFLFPRFSTFSTPCGKQDVEIQTHAAQGMNRPAHILPTGFSTIRGGMENACDGTDGLLLTLAAGNQIDQAVLGNGLG